MDVSVEDLTADGELAKRVEAGRESIKSQIPFFREHFGRVASEWKADATRVTAVDRAVSQNILGGLGGSFPDDDLFSEELDPAASPYPRKGRFSWVLDPIDGTNNYALGIPFCAISLGLLRDGLPVYGFLYDFARDRTIEGGLGFGVRDGDQLARVGAAAPNAESVVGMHSPRDKALAPLMEPLVARFKVRAMGSSALHLAYVAIGLFDGVVDLNVKVWDIAAAHALCLASGAKIKFLSEPVFPLNAFDVACPNIHYCAGNPAMAEQLQQLIRR